MNDASPLWLQVGIAELNYFVTVIGSIVLHEAGHAIAAKLAGLDMRLVSIGKGRVLFRRQAGRVAFTWRLMPFSGYVALAARPGMSHARYTFVVAAGPAVNAAVLGLAILLAGRFPAHRSLINQVCFVQAAMLLFTLTPYNLRFMSGRPSDGWQLWTHLVRRPGDMFTAQLRAIVGPLDNGAWIPAPTEDGIELVYQIGRNDQNDDRHAGMDAFAAVLRLVEAGGLNPLERFIALRFLAIRHVLFFVGDMPAAQLDRWSDELCQLAPPHVTALVRGGILATTGRGAEAELLLKPLVGAEAPVEARCLGMLHLAQAAAALGHAEDMRIWLYRAEQAGSAYTPARRTLLNLVALAEKHPPLAPMTHAAIRPA